MGRRRDFLLTVFFLNLASVAISKDNVLPEQTYSNFNSYQARIDSVEEGQYVTVFNKPGLNWTDCTKVFDKDTQAEKCKEAVGWPSRDAKITVISPPTKHKVRNLYWDGNDPKDQFIEEEYVEVEFEYKREGKDQKIYHQKGTGFLELAYLSRSVYSPYYGAQASSVQKSLQKQAPCDDKKSSVSSDLKKLSEDLKPLAKSVENMSVVQKADQLSKIVGFCPLKPPTKKPDYKGKANVYDHYILSKLPQNPPPGLVDENGKPMTQQQLIEIDALSRTLYGEMARCYKHGLHYPMAVAKIIVNRKQSKRDTDFIKPPHAKGKPKIAQLATSPSQFSMWWSKINGKPNGPLHQGLCPPQVRGKGFWRSDSAPNQEHDIWLNTVRIATEAILHPGKFNGRTAEVTSMHYTSGMAGRPNDWMSTMSQVHPTIEGRKIRRDSCLEIWQEKNKSR